MNNCYKKKEKSSYKHEFSEEHLNEKSTPMFTNTHNDANKTIHTRELGNIIEIALENIPEIYRIVFSLREINGISVAEAAELLNLSETNIKVRLSRAKEMLRNELEKSYTASELYEFNLVYCNAMVEKVMAEIYEL